MDNNRKVVLYISMSFDGYIATEDNSIDFLNLVHKEGEDYGYNHFVDSVDTVIIGRKTYQKVLDMGYEYPHTDKDVYIITRNEKPSLGSFHFYTGSLLDLVKNIKSKPGKNIYCDGGSELVFELMKNNLIDEFIVSVVPVFLGRGIPLFKPGRKYEELHLIDTKVYDTGLVQMHYRKK